MFSPARTLSVALAAALLFASCGSDDGTADSDTTAAPTATELAVTETTPETTPDTTPETTPDTTEATAVETTTDTPAQDVAADTASAAVAVLTITDLPEGWSETPADGDSTSEIDQRLAECAGADALAASEARVATGDFVNPDGSLVVSQSVTVQASERDARTTVALLTAPDVPECLAAAYSELGAAALSTGAVPDDAEIGEVTASRLVIAPAGDATQAIRVVVPVTSGGTTTDVTVDHVITRAGRTIATLALEGRVVATAIETIDETVAASTSRLAS